MNPPPEEVSRVRPQWHQLVDLVEGARKAGFSPAQVDYLTSVMGITWAKAYNAGLAARGPR